MTVQNTKKRTRTKKEEPKPVVDEVPAPVVEIKSVPRSLFECMKRRRDKEK